MDDPIGFLKSHPPPVILDEIQYIPEFLHYIKTAIDENRQPGQMYFLDPTIASFLTGLHDSEPLLNGPMIGHLFETAVISEWVKAFYHRGVKPELFYWRSKAGLEIDLLIDRNQRLFPLETKASATLLPGHVKTLNKWRNLAGEKTVKGVIVANIDNSMEVSGCHAISWKLAL